ncbi:MAG: phosphate acyltransferase [Candidatus Latescibacterota bacterium]
MNLQKRIIESVSEIGKSHIGLSAYERQLETAGISWLEDITARVGDYSDERIVHDAEAELSSVVESLRNLTGSPCVNILLGKILSFLITLERSESRSRKIMKRLLDSPTASHAAAEEKRLLIINPTTGSTRVAFFQGIDKIAEEEIHLSPDEPNGVDGRVESVISWMDDNEIDLKSLHGIACRSGFLHPVPSGTYRLVPEMLKDLEEPRIEHASNLSVAMVMKLDEIRGHKGDLLLTTSDPVVSDEIETVERLTGFIKIRRDGTGAHYLNHRAIWKLLSRELGRSPNDVNALTGYLGRGFSIARHRNGKVTSVVDAFSDMPSTSRCGPLDLPRLIDAIKKDTITFKELEAATFSRGGLLSLAGTNDFRALEGFRFKGATSIQQKKIELLFDFFARQITASALKLTADGKPIDFLALTGGLARSEELSRRIESNIGGRYPLIFVPGSIDQEFLAAGLIEGFYEPETLKNYVEERDALKQKHMEEDRLIDTVIFERKVIYRKKDAPILTLDELIDDTSITVKENYMPTIAIVGADNEEAILAAKRANEEGNFRIAKFKLLGDFAAINQIAYDFDLIIDNDNYSIIDTETPVEDALKMLERNEVQILMKGYMKTEDILRGVFHFLKNTGRLRSGELISHVFVMDIPVRNKLLLITDAAVNTYPNEEKRVKIIENALKIAFNLYIKKPKVAVISAIESVNPSIESSIEAEIIARHFAGRQDCIVEGPISFDVAMNPAIAHEKHYKGQIQGNADILIMPDIDAGNVLYKSLTTQSGAIAAGVILCGDMPLILTSRGDSARSKLSSISLAVKLFFNLGKEMKSKSDKIMPQAAVSIKAAVLNDKQLS